LEKDKIKIEEAEDPELEKFYEDMIRVEREKAERARKTKLTQMIRNITKKTK